MPEISPAPYLYLKTLTFQLILRKLSFSQFDWFLISTTMNFFNIVSISKCITFAIEKFLKCFVIFRNINLKSSSIEIFQIYFNSKLSQVCESSILYHASYSLYNIKKLEFDVVYKLYSNKCRYLHKTFQQLFEQIELFLLKIIKRRQNQNSQFQFAEAICRNWQINVLKFHNKLIIIIVCQSGFIWIIHRTSCGQITIQLYVHFSAQSWSPLLDYYV